MEVRVPAYTQRHEPPKGMSGMPRTNTTHLDRFADHFLADEIKPPHKPTPEELAEQAAAEERKAAELMAQWHEKRRKSGIEPPLAAEEAT